MLFGDNLILGKQNSVGNCAHENKKSFVGKFGPHFAKEVCKDCGKFLRWMKDPNFEGKMLDVGKLEETK